MDGFEVNEQHERLSLGDFIATQRRAAEMSLRQLADRAGISNPYVSQIERGLRKPSAEVLNQIATALSVSAESLYVRAGIIDPDEHRPTSVQRAVQSDPALTAAQKQALITVYLAFVQPDAGPHPTPTPDVPAASKE
ncbi:helix-turn-helix transcriptional regulator [Propioniciclava sp. MC1595]|uniref:helix-turn-helix domain-containing protein n=1 Tax=unclassified Propioniciclava TaxID=2642922 RepID=UPI0015FF3A24|nr:MULTISPECIES: helix-turn-helix transcriptional regulator [unclassified Propioniciclava]MBB1496056.1 helix-turn-helix transcriptional regulator [Propioniciclava sp. MC1595]MBB1499885.1 helix-turn-helix transcriptional regulator [Propioniciclava sp. MC1683]NLE17935.1 helix-turn-helix transcriptional regulator [Propioniciclava sp.]QTE26765.1 helix-turn-helix transcriptional regulator [Propioniciclava sp. MC1595]